MNFLTGDFNGDPRTDLLAINPDYFPQTRMLSYPPAGASLKYRGYTYGSFAENFWTLRAQDQMIAADINGDHRDDRIALNRPEYTSHGFPGILRSVITNNADTLNASWQGGWIGAWHFNSGDRIAAMSCRGNLAWDDLLIYNSNWMGLLRSQREAFTSEAIYPQWIHNHRYHALGYW